VVHFLFILFMRLKFSSFGSLDQTTRVHAETQVEPLGTKARVWREVARPQVHGYDLLSGVFLDPLRFVSIADEKIARVFDAPQSFVTLINSICDENIDASTVRVLIVCYIEILI
jgi:elongator complex protein 2